jgi:hypothetical protein
LIPQSLFCAPGDGQQQICSQFRCSSSFLNNVCITLAHFTRGSEAQSCNHWRCTDIAHLFLSFAFGSDLDGSFAHWKPEDIAITIKIKGDKSPIRFEASQAHCIGQGVLRNRLVLDDTTDKDSISDDLLNEKHI